MTPAGLLALQALAGNKAVAGLVAQRSEVGAGQDDLQSSRFSSSAKLEACFDDRDRLRAGDSDGDAVARVQSALLDMPLKTGNTYDLGPTGADGLYGNKTSAAIRKFKGDESLGFANIGDVGPGTMRRLDALFKDGGGVQPGPRDKKKENEILGGLFHNPDLENLFDRIMLQYGRMLAKQGEALTAVQQDLATTEKAEPSIAQTVLLKAAELVIDKTLGGGDTLRAVAAAGLKGISDADLVQSGMDKVVGATFDAAVTGGKDGVKANIAPGGLETQPLAKFIDAQHNALIESTNQATEAFVAKKQGAGGADQGLRTFTEADKAQIFASFPAVADPRVNRAQKLLQGLQDSSSKARDMEYSRAVQQWSVGNAQQATDDGFNPGGVPATDGNALRGKGRNTVPGVLEISFSFDAKRPKDPAQVNELSISGLSVKARTQITKLQGDVALRQLSFVERASGGSISLVKTETGQIFNNGDDDQNYLTNKGDGVFVFGERKLFEELETATINNAGGLKGPSTSIF